MAQIKIEVSPERKARVEISCRIRGMTIEQRFEALLQDIEREIGYDPADDSADQAAALARAGRRAAKAEAERLAAAVVV